MERIYATISYEIKHDTVIDKENSNEEYIKEIIIEAIAKNDIDFGELCIEIDEVENVTQEYIEDEADKLNDDIALGLI